MLNNNVKLIRYLSIVHTSKYFKLALFGKNFHIIAHKQI